MEILLFTFWLVCGIIAAMIGGRKGMGTSGFLIGVLLGPLGVLIAHFSKGDRKTCSSCKELVHKEAKVCPHCQRDFPVAVLKVVAMKCPACGKEGQSDESLLKGEIECPSCKKVFPFSRFLGQERKLRYDTGD